MRARDGYRILIELEDASRGSLHVDEELAFELFRTEALALQVLAQDMAFARSIGQAMDADAAILQELTAAESASARDHDMAVALSQGRRYVPSAVPAASGKESTVRAANEQQSFQEGSASPTKGKSSHLPR